MARLVLIKNLLSEQAVRLKIEKAVDTAKTVNWTHWFNDVPVPQQLLPYMTTLSKSMPRMKFYPIEVASVWDNAGVNGETKHFFIVDEFIAYMDEYPFGLGQIGYRDYSVDGSDSTYGVRSRKISNSKFRPDREQHNMMMTNDMKKAVKLAQTYLVPYSTRELATAYYKGIRSNVENVFESARNSANAVVETLRQNNTLLAELMHLKSLGVKFKTQEFTNASEKIEDAYKLLQEETLRTVTAVFVRFRKVGEDTYVDVQPVEDIRKNYSNPKVVSPATTYTMADLPEDIVRSVSVLSILNDKQYVARVGQKLDEFTYWVERG